MDTQPALLELEDEAVEEILSLEYGAIGEDVVKGFWIKVSRLFEFPNLPQA
ncbi:MAG: hypothetical protein KME11_18950 [Timaviella obliquedivisa GSE-PSE-MK23-08B]|jgi:hypothetical protein|nr:hypothetical protein [Timaviella obliquedivisa GSE-PSE-MK23-08B]